MTDRPEYQDATMDKNEALNYAYDELGKRIEEVNTLPNHDVEKYWGKIRSQYHVSSFTKCENGYILQGGLSSTIINPKAIIGKKPRMWMSGNELVIYFKKEGKYYLFLLKTQR